MRVDARAAQAPRHAFSTLFRTGGQVQAPVSLRRDGAVARWIVLAAVVVMLIVAGGGATAPALWQTTPPPSTDDSYALRISFGYGPKPQESWVGTVRAENARILDAKGWLFRSEDRIS